MKKVLIAIAVLLMAAQSQGASKVAKAVKKAGTYPVKFITRLKKPVMVRVFPRRKLPKCRPWKFKMGAKDAKTMPVPKLCCWKEALISYVGVKKPIASTSFKGTCLRGASAYLISEENGKVRIKGVPKKGTHKKKKAKKKPMKRTKKQVRN